MPSQESGPITPPEFQAYVENACSYLQAAGLAFAEDKLQEVADNIAKAEIEIAKMKQVIMGN